MEPTFHHDSEAEQFQLRADDEVVSLLAYRRAQNVLVLAHAETAPGHGRQGLAARVTAGAIEHARREGAQVLPMCGYVRRYMAEHPETLDLVPDRYLDAFGLREAAESAGTWSARPT